MKVFLGITGASGAPYAKGILDGLVSAGAEVGVCASSAGIEVLATELYGDATLPRDEVLSRLIDGAAGVTIYAPDDWKSPYASGSARIDAYVVCPCSMSTVGHARLGGDDEPDPPRRLGRAEGAADDSCSSLARRPSPRFTCAASRP